MTHFHLFRRDAGSEPEPEPGSGGGDTASTARPDAERLPDPTRDRSRFEARGPRVRRASSRVKMMDGCRGIKHAIRADSSFFAHAYRGLLIAISAAILKPSWIGWCFLVASAALILIAEMAHSAVRALALALEGRASEQEIRTACEIAEAGVLVASLTSAIITTTVLVTRLGDVLGW